MLGTAAFGGLGLLVAGTLRAEVTLAAANLIWLVLLFAGGIAIPLTKYPHGVASVLQYLPVGGAVRRAAPGAAGRRGSCRSHDRADAARVGGDRAARRGPVVPVGVTARARGRLARSAAGWLPPDLRASRRVGVANVRDRRDRRRGAADRLRPGLPDLADVHRLVAHADEAATRSTA